MLDNKMSLDILENIFNINEVDDELELETWTNGGVDMIVYISKENIADSFCEYVDNFDIDDEIETERQDKRYCDAFTFKESIADFEDFKNTLEETVEQLKGNTGKLSTELLKDNDSYIDALQEAINLWKDGAYEDKAKNLKAIGEIGYEIYKLNVCLNIR